MVVNRKLPDKYILIFCCKIFLQNWNISLIHFMGYKKYEMKIYISILFSWEFILGQQFLKLFLQHARIMLLLYSYFGLPEIIFVDKIKNCA